MLDYGLSVLDYGRGKLSLLPDYGRIHTGLWPGENVIDTPQTMALLTDPPRTMALAPPQTMADTHWTIVSAI